jgi:hypothetical protein
MIPTQLSPQAPMPTRPEQMTGLKDPVPLQWVDQFSEEMLQTVQAFQRLHAALQNRMLGK